MPLDTVLCLDCSGSMANRGIRELKAAALKFIEGVEDTARQAGIKENVAIIEFGARTRVVQSLTNNYQLLRTRLNCLSASGTTPMKDGLLLAMKEIIENGGVVSVNGRRLSPRIVLLTDGKPTNENGNSTDDAWKEVLAVAIAFGQQWKEVHLPHPIPIACVGCGDADQKLLEAIAKVTSGMYVIVDNMSELSTFFRRQVLLSRFFAQFSHDMSQLQSIVALHRFMQAMGEAVEEAETRALMTLLLAMLISDDDDEKGNYPDPPPEGSRVRRGADWKWGSQDESGPGTVVSTDDNPGWVKVQWDSGGNANSYRYGKENAFDVRKVDEPRTVSSSEGLKVGVRVLRGNDWKWGNQDGGPGSIGRVYHVSPLGGTVKVRWSNGQNNTYRNGAEGARDLRVYPQDLVGPRLALTSGGGLMLVSSSPSGVSRRRRGSDDCVVM